MDIIDAIRLNDIETLKVLLTKGEDANRSDDDCNITPLHFAVQAESLEAVHLLLEHGANPYLMDTSRNMNPYEWACFLECQEIADYLNRYMVKH